MAESVSNGVGSRDTNGVGSGDKQPQTIKVGSRKSQLALVQTEWVISELCGNNSSIGNSFEVIKISTIGDKIQNQALSKIGEKSLFTKELEIALENQEVAFVVHSLKDLPTTLPDGMVIGAICVREDPSDALVVANRHEAKSLQELKEGSVVGTSSLRRIAQLSRIHPNLKFNTIRGNLNTRLAKLDTGEDYSALVLAAAGLKRLGFENRIVKRLPECDCMHAVGQGALAVECRANDTETIALLSSLCHRETTLCCVAERSFMKCLGGGCSVPIAVSSKLENTLLKLTGGVFSLDGADSIILSLNVKLPSENLEPMVKKVKDSVHFCGVIPTSACLRSELQFAEQLGKDLGNIFLEKGARKILDNARALN